MTCQGKNLFAVGLAREPTAVSYRLISLQAVVLLEYSATLNKNSLTASICEVIVVEVRALSDGKFG